MKNNTGVSLMSLIITVVVMVVLISIVGYFSLDSVKNSYTANEKKELSDVVQYVSVRKAKLLVDEFDVKEKYKDAILTEESIYLLAKGLSESELALLVEVNNSSHLDDNYKYFYITAENLNRELASTEALIIKDVKNNYIINFFTGTIIGLYDNGNRAEISGSIKGLADIMNDLY